YEYPANFSFINPGLSSEYPYRFIASKLGVNVDSMKIIGAPDNLLGAVLTANVVQPHIWGRSGCLLDTLTAGDTATTAVRLGNFGTDSLVVDTFAINGPNAADWTISGIYNSTTGETETAPPWRVTLVGRTPATPYGDVAYVNLLYRATYNGTPTETISFSGYDALGRHANDSLNSTYNWGSFPYDTTINIVDCIAAGVSEHGNESTLPSNMILSQNYPNPFSLATTFTFTAPQSRDYRVDIYNDLGVRIASLQTSEVQPGKYSAAWSASGWASGVYYYRVSTRENNNISGAAKSFLLLR
ncbi:MAG TPA: T9SS type A sorting domain-containing protein, partial [Candidatus Kapabacteria bacterium]|nr:T9SS type A sorting domain-containing protein [Candidatus Kapabacteria bacterium]